MRIVDHQASKSFLEKRRRRFNEPGQPCELTFSCSQEMDDDVLTELARG
jgi:hypothetical protein